MEQMLREWDGENVIIRHDKPTGSWIIIAIHSTRLGPAVGGTRMKSYPDLKAALEDALRLSSGMTYKFAVPGLPYGGGKAVIAIPSELDNDSRNGLLMRHGALIAQLKGIFMTGPDVGISSDDMDIIGQTGSPFVFSKTVKAGGAGTPGPFTALGVFTGIEVVCERIFGDRSLKSRSILVQGTGSVGGGLIDLLIKAGAKVMFNEISESAIERYRDKLGLTYIKDEELFDTECDVFAPCALGGVFDADTIPRLNCKAIAGGANNQLAGPEDGERLRQRGILYAPDFVINIGGAMAITGIETQGHSREKAVQDVVDTVRRSLAAVIENANTENISTDSAARLIAKRRLSK